MKYTCINFGLLTASTRFNLTARLEFFNWVENWKIWLDQWSTSQLTGQKVWMVNWPVRLIVSRCTVKSLMRCHFMRLCNFFCSRILSSRIVDGNETLVRWIHLTFEVTHHIQNLSCDSENCIRGMFTRKILDWSRKFWLVNELKSLSGQWLVNQ